jgi:hypothetical protein
VRGRAPAQAGLLAAREDRRQIAGLDARRAMPDAVDAPVLAQQGAAAEAMRDLVRGDAGAHQLRAGDQSMLTRRKPSEHHLHCGRLVGHAPI